MGEPTVSGRYFYGRAYYGYTYTAIDRVDLGTGVRTRLTTTAPAGTLAGDASAVWVISSGVLTRIDALTGDEPWSGYDELTVEEIRAAVGDDDQRASAVRRYERAHKNRAGVLSAVERELANA